MDGAGIAAVLSLGAQAAQIGTALHPLSRERRDGDSSCAHCWLPRGRRHDADRPLHWQTGAWLAQSLHPRVGACRFPKLPFPAQSQLTSKLRTAAAQAGAPDFLALWAGQAASPLCSDACRRQSCCKRIERETFEAIERVASLRHAVSKATT